MRPSIWVMLAQAACAVRIASVPGEVRVQKAVVWCLNSL
ncbi:hypothetical protein BLL52_3278 [Rhodoferax antarcticus ANT.BR]|uniref:Uncharacterized protein n=1 Tax=Rhodoferax antarcticus ANT.BR TaxID=1111071 RepID=A0A1Q8YCR2_9BURK|nr:hypothetical protein BLL52_3278 [Rhodoferax antarcticus ANT.BR]